MTTGLPKQPTFRSIIVGISLFLLVILAFFRIAEIVKYTGVILMYLPSRIGLIDMVMPGDVITASVATSPTTVTLPAAGSYALYTENYDLLFLHNAAVEAGKLTWIKISSEETGQAIPIQVVTRGLAVYDTPFARGRPMLTFTVTRPGRYSIIHPTRPDSMYIVPDVFTGAEALISVVLWAEVGLALAVGFFLFRRWDAPRRQRKREVQELSRQRIEAQREKVKKLNAMADEGAHRIMDEYEPDNLWKKKKK